MHPEHKWPSWVMNKNWKLAEIQGKYLFEIGETDFPRKSSDFRNYTCIFSRENDGDKLKRLWVGCVQVENLKFQNRPRNLKFFFLG